MDETPSQSFLLAQSDLELAVGAIFVFAYSYSRFSTPSTNRASTTAGLYWMAFASYSLTILIIYYILAKSPPVLNAVMEFIIGSGESQLVEQISELSAPIIAALMLTVTLPRVPVLSTLDKWLTGAFYRIGAIPKEARRLSKQLRDSKFEPPPELVQATGAELSRLGFDDEDAVFQSSDDPRHLWTRIVALMTSVQNLPTDASSYREFIASYTVDYTDIVDQYNALIPKAKSCFDLMREAAIYEDEKFLRAVGECRGHFAHQSDILFRDLCDFIARGILVCEKTRASRRSRSAKLGFDFEDIGVSFDLLIVVFGIVVAVMGTTFGIIGTRMGGFEQASLRVIMISIMYSIAVFCAVYPKTRWSFANMETLGRRPLAFYLLAGTLAAATSYLVSLIFRIMIFRDVDLALADWLLSYPWMVMPFFTAVAVAFQTDDKPAWWPQRPAIFWEGLFMCLVGVLSAFLAFHWLTDIGTRSGTPPNFQIPGLYMLAPVAGIIGALIGVTVPSWWREMRSDESHEPQDVQPA